MPAKSKSQFRFMEAVAHGSVKKKGLSKAKAKEFVSGQSPKDLPEKVKPGSFSRIASKLRGKRG